MKRLFAAVLVVLAWLFLGAAPCGKLAQELQRLYCWSFQACDAFGSGMAGLLGLIAYVAVLLFLCLIAVGIHATIVKNRIAAWWRRFMAAHPPDLPVCRVCREELADPDGTICPDCAEAVLNKFVPEWRSGGTPRNKESESE